MGELKGFLHYHREKMEKEPVEQRIKHSREFIINPEKGKMEKQGARCMDCGVPFCHQGCPLGNHIPDWNHLVSAGLWREAFRALEETNNFPEMTGRVCPAPCETACVLGINDDPVAIESLEMSIADKGIAEGWSQPRPPHIRLSQKVGIIGSGPAGLAAAQQLNRRGYLVTVYERADRAGGLLMYGIPTFKLEKQKVMARIHQLKLEGVQFQVGANVGESIVIDDLIKEYDAILLTCGASQARDIKIPGRELSGIYLADSFLQGHTRFVLGDTPQPSVSARGKDVIVIGGGDTGSDCVGTSHRHGARSVRQFEILSQPPNLGPYPRAWERPENSPWPDYTHLLRTSTSQEEGGERSWNLRTKAFIADQNGRLQSLLTESLKWETKKNGQLECTVVPGSEREWACQVAFIAVGFVGPERGLVDQLGLELEQHGGVKTDRNYMTNQPGIFAAGDMRRGQSLVVWAIQEGRSAAASVHSYLQAHKESLSKGH